MYHQQWKKEHIKWTNGKIWGVWGTVGFHVIKLSSKMTETLKWWDTNKKKYQKILNKFAYITPKYKKRYTESPKIYKTFEISPFNDFNL